MSFLNYIGEFFFFRWLFGSRKRGESMRERGCRTPRKSFPADVYDASGRDISDNHNHGYSQSYDDFLDEQDDYDMMDDDF